MATVATSTGTGGTADSTRPTNTTTHQTVPAGLKQEVPIDVTDAEQFYRKLTSATECNSLLRKHLTRAIFDKLKDRRTCFGGTLAQCIRSGCEHPDTSVGIFASDPHAYDIFSEIFDPIIKEYFHLPDKKPLHRVCGDLGEVNKIKLNSLDPEGKFIAKTRIQIVRSFEGFAFPPILTAQNRKEIESKALEALNSLSDDLKGTYHSLADMNEDTRKEFLFHQNDKLLASAGCYNDWPTGRGIFHNESKTFLAWINEEDHVKIVSVGSDFGAVYKRIILAYKTLQEKLKFSCQHGIGFVTFNPKNLGSTLQVYVQVKIPLLYASENFQTLCNKLNLQVLGIQEEQGLIELSNKKRLCSTEHQIVHELYRGIKEVIQQEKELAWYPTNVQEMFEHLHKAKNCKSLLKKYLTKSIFEKLKAKKTSHNATLGDCILSGVLNLDSVIGIYAADPESYSGFASLFDPVIKDYYKLKPSSPIAHPDSDFGDLENLVFADVEDSMIVSSRIFVSRSIKDFAFLPVLQRQDRYLLEQKCVDTFKTLTGELKGDYYSLKDMSNEVRESLARDHCLFNDTDKYLKAAGVYRDWPLGRGIFLNDNKTLMVWVNADDHLKIVSMQKDENIDSVYRRLITALKVLDEKLMFVRDNNLGYLTLCPSNLGTALRVSICVKIPHLTAKKHFKYICETFNLLSRAVRDNDPDTASEPGHGIVVISNKESFGVREIRLMRETVDGVHDLLYMEKEYSKTKSSSCHVM